MGLFKLFLFFVASTVLVIGCGETTKDELKPTPQIIPEELGFKPSAKGAVLTETQKEELKLAIGGRPSLVLPDAELMFDSTRFKSNAFTEKEEKLKAKSLSSYNFLKDIQSNCHKAKPSETPAGNLKLQNDGVQFNEAKVGHDLILKSSAQLAGENCPVTFDFHYDISALVTEVEADKNVGKANGRLIQDGQAIMVAPKYMRLLKTRGVILSSRIDALNIRQSADNKVLLKYTFKGSYLSLLQNIPISGHSSMLTKTDKDGKKTREFSLSMEVATKKVSVVAEMHSKDIDKTIVFKKFYLNGNETTEAEFNEIFGTENPLLNAKKTLAAVN